MVMIEVKSSNLMAIGYDEQNSKLFVRFKDGGWLYEYSGVPLIVWLGLRECKSKGAYLQSQVIRYFSCRRVMEQKFKVQ